MEQQSGTHTAPALATDAVAQLARFDGAPREFLSRLLELQCNLTEADSAAILTVDSDRRVKILVVHPELRADETTPVWLAQSADDATRLMASGQGEVTAVNRPGRNGAPAEHVVQLPLRREGDNGSASALGVYVVSTDDDAALQRTHERLELTSGLISVYEMRLAMQSRYGDMARLRSAMEVVDAVNEHRRFKAAAIAICNEFASRWQAERVSLGFLKGRYVKVAAISHTEKFDRKMKLVQDIEAAMEECLDQNIEVIDPAPEHSGVVCRAARELSLRHGPTSVFSVPLRHDGEPLAVVTVERPVTSPLTGEEAETLRLACDLCTARLLDLRDHDKWIGAKAVDAVRDGCGMLVGPRHTWAKLTAAAVVTFLAFAFLVKGPDRVDASFQIKAVERRMIPVPFDGRIQAVLIEPGDVAMSGETVLARLETAELQLQLASARAERASYLKEADLALREGKTAEVQIAEANRQKVDAQIRLLEHRVEQATIVAPIGGTIVAGDLKRQIGGPVQKGDLLFEIAPMSSLRAELEVPEDRITDLLGEDGSQVLRGGTLASVSHPGEYIPFEVERINPVAEVIDQKNVFRVRVRLLETRPWLRPGMKGVAKVTVGRRPYASLWTRTFVNWVRMKLWI